MMKLTRSAPGIKLWFTDLVGWVCVKNEIEIDMAVRRFNFFAMIFIAGTEDCRHPLNTGLNT